MKGFRVKKIDGSSILKDYTGDLYAVEFMEDNGEGWFTLSTHLSFEGADRKMRDHVAQNLECALWEEKMFDVTGVELLPGDPERCQGNGQHPEFECCCDECDHFLTCWPDCKEQLQND